MVSYLRPSDVDGAKHAWAILALLVKRLRQAWPGVFIIFRGDSGFCRPRMLSWCDNHDVAYVIGLAKNSQLLARTTKRTDALMEQAYQIAGMKVRYITEIDYAAQTWDRERRVVVRMEYGDKGSDVRFVVTNLNSPVRELYECDYCQRGEMENRIKEQKCDLKADRTSCQQWWANQFRLMLTSCAYVLIDALRREVLNDTELASAQVATIRVKLLKIGTVMIRNTRRVRFLFSRHYPYQTLFSQIIAKLVPG